MELASLSGRKGGTHTALPEFPCVSIVSEDDMNYHRIYSEFIADRRAKEAPLSGYTEKHHILPRSLGGGESKANLVALSAGDHFFAHLLLAKAHGGVQWRGVEAMADMPGSSKRRDFFARRLWVEKARIEGAKLRAIATANQHRTTGLNLKANSDTAKAKKSATMSAPGYKWFTDGTVNMRVAVGLGEVSPYGFRSGKTHKGYAISPESRARISAAVSASNKGRGAPNKGIPMSEDQRARMSGTGHYTQKQGYIPHPDKAAIAKRASDARWAKHRAAQQGVN